jgi:glycosyltransferase involved in cell wall biosynthesis
MKVIYGHDVFTEQEYGGVTRYFSEIIQRINKSDFELEIISGLYFNEYLKYLHFGDDYQINGLAINKNLIANKYSLRSINEVYQSILLKDLKNVVYHQTYYSPFPIRKNLKAVVTVHDMVHEIFPEMFHKFNVTSYSKRTSCNRAEKIIAISQSTKNDLINIFNIDPSRVEVIYHGSNFSEIFKDIEPRQDESPYLLFVGKRQGYKNFDRILKIFARSQSISTYFKLICFGGGSFTREEIQKIEEYKLNDIVHHQSGPDSILAQYYRSARALIYPSLYEGFGIPLLEAMSMYCPVICSNSSSLPEVAADAAEYFDPKETEDMQAILEKTLFDDLLLSQLSQRGFLRQQQFKWDKTAGQTLNLYKSLLDM